MAGSGQGASRVRAEGSEIQRQAFGQQEFGIMGKSRHPADVLMILAALPLAVRPREAGAAIFHRRTTYGQAAFPQEVENVNILKVRQMAQPWY